MRIFEIEKDLLGKQTPSFDDLVKKHQVSKEFLLRQLKFGIKVEQEHTDDASLAREIALDHLSELPDYYSRLDKMEKDAS